VGVFRLGIFPHNPVFFSDGDPYGKLKHFLFTSKFICLVEELFASERVRQGILIREWIQSSK